LSGRPAKTFKTAVDRWSGLGPYYAMFPVDFAFEVVNEFSEPGDKVLDPFAGRASSIFAAHALGRTGSGIEINPVGWLYGRTKMHPASDNHVLARLEEIGRNAHTITEEEIAVMPQFFHCCYSKNVLRFLLYARRHLKWQDSRVDGTLMAIILVDLHGKEGSALSNQMRQGKAMSPEYSIEWWKAKQKTPPDLEPMTFLKKKVVWRYSKGIPRFNSKAIIYGDSLRHLPMLNRRAGSVKYKLLFTSPPYYSITNYFYDQWLRIWMLGGPEYPTYDGRSRWQKKFASKEGYKTLLEAVFSRSKKLLSKDAILYIRTDARAFTLNTTLDVLTDLYPEKSIERIDRPTSKPSQTALFGDKSSKPGEVDIILR